MTPPGDYTASRMIGDATVTIISEGSMEHVKKDPKVVEVYLGH